MKLLKSWRSILMKRSVLFDGGKCGLKMKQLPFMGVVCTVMLFIVYRTTNYQHKQTEVIGSTNPFECVTCDSINGSSTIVCMNSPNNGCALIGLLSFFFNGPKEVMDKKFHPFGSEFLVASRVLDGLPRGIIHTNSDLELRPLWTTSSSRSKVNDYSHRNLLAIPVGIEQKNNVDDLVQRFLPENFTIILFHYDGNVDGWWDLEWSNEAIHIVAQNQTKWWFAKRFLHPDVVSIYDYIFLWDEDLGVENFHPGRYLKIVKSEGLEISQPALDPNSTDIHHRITIRSRTKKFHRRVYDLRGSTKCSDASEGPPCTGFVEGMAPVFSRSAWRCTWHLIQNDLVHGWGMDMKLGYCAQGDRTQKVGVVDREYIVHKGIQSLGGAGSSAKKTSHSEELTKRHGGAADMRMEIRRQSTWELQVFKERWNRAVEGDKDWVDPFKSVRRQRKRRRNHH